MPNANSFGVRSDMLRMVRRLEGKAAVIAELGDAVAAGLPAERWKVVEVQVLDEAVASDHRAIFAVLELLPGKTQE